MGAAKSIDKRILGYLKTVRMASTREIAQALDYAWHTVNTHCLKLQIAGDVDGFKLGNMNVWRLKQD